MPRMVSIARLCFPMLHYHAIPLAVKSLLLEISPLLLDSQYYLAGGTSLALRYGHRLSVDLDYFTGQPLEKEFILSLLAEKITGISDQSSGAIQLLIEGIKVEFLRHDYPLLGEIETVDSIRMVSIKDAAAMKINAICNRGSKKDFFDLQVLLQTFSLQEMLNFYQKKYAVGHRFMAIRSLVWFDDADAEPDPESLDGVSWEAVKNQLLQQVALL